MLIKELPCDTENIGSEVDNMESMTEVERLIPEEVCKVELLASVGVLKDTLCDMLYGLDNV